MKTMIVSLSTLLFVSAALSAEPLPIPGALSAEPLPTSGAPSSEPGPGGFDAGAESISSLRGGRAFSCAMIGLYVGVAVVSHQWWAVAGGLIGAYHHGCF